MSKIFNKFVICVKQLKLRYKCLICFGLLFGIIYMNFPSLENIIKKIVHDYGSKVIGTDVSIKGVNFKPASGYVSINGIKIENPKQYKSKNLFYLDKLDIKINVSSLMDDLIIVDSIQVDNPKITYEMLSLTENNISYILNNINKNSSETSSVQENLNKSDENKKQSAKKVIIKNLNINNGTISVMTGIGDLKKELSLPLPKIEMHNIGQEKQGSSIKDTINLVISKILNSTTETIVSKNLNEFKQAAKEEFKNLSSNLKNEAGLAKDKLKDGLKNLIHF